MNCTLCHNTVGSLTKKVFLFGHFFFNITDVFCAKQRVALVQ